MKVQESRMRWMLRGTVLLVCCLVLWGCRSWGCQPSRAMDADVVALRRPKPVFIWRQGPDIYESISRVKVKKNDEFVHWSCNERFQIDYKGRDYPLPTCTQAPDSDGLYHCKSDVFPRKDLFSYKITIYPSSGDPIWKDPEIEVLE